MNERPDTERIKAQLAADIVRIVGELGLTDAQVGERLTLSDGEVRRLRGGQLDEFSIEWLVSLLNKLDRTVTFEVTNAPAESLKKKDTRPIWERIAEIAADVPPEEWEKLPTDLAENHDHYLYGTPKQY